MDGQVLRVDVCCGDAEMAATDLHEDGDDEHRGVDSCCVDVLGAKFGFC